MKKKTTSKNGAKAPAASRGNIVLPPEKADWLTPEDRARVVSEGVINVPDLGQILAVLHDIREHLFMVSVKAKLDMNTAGNDDWYGAYMVKDLMPLFIETRWMDIENKDHVKAAQKKLSGRRGFKRPGTGETGFMLQGWVLRKYGIPFPLPPVEG